MRCSYSLTRRPFASYRSWLCSIAIVVALFGCKKKKLEVVNDPQDSTDYGRADLMAAIDTMSRTPSSAEAFRKFHLTVEGARGRFNETIAALAERHIVFAALGPLEAVASASPDLRMNKLALTVWPTAFHVEPEKDELPMQYLQRLCSDELAGECKHVVPEAWAVRLSTLAWRRLQSRARDAYVRCRQCKNTESYESALERYDENTTRANSELASERKRTSPSGWPRSGEHASEYAGAPILSITNDGAARFRGEEIAGGKWREAIRIQRGDQQVLGVHLRPTASVHTLRGILRDAAKAGYTEIALVVRRPSFPWTLVEYRISTSRRGRTNVDSRDEDTIQVLVRALDATTKRVASEGGNSPPLRL